MNSKNIPHSLPVDAERLIPHEPPMLLVKRLIEKDDDAEGGSTSIIEAEVPLSGPFICKGQLMPEYFIEVMAQAIAASDGYPQLEGQKPTTGLLTGIDCFSLSGDVMPGEIIRITLRKTFEFGSAFIFSGSVTSDSKQIAEGQLKIWKLEE